MHIAYFGTPELSAELLKALLKNNVPISYVVTQPDKPAGKRLQITPSPVKELAVSYKIDYYDRSLSRNTSIDLVNIFKDRTIDLCILFAYGRLITSDLLYTPQYSFWNIHPSLLPLYRGASPTTYPILLGEAQTGVTLMQMNEQLDEGDILNQQTFDIQHDMTRRDIETKSVQIATNQIITSLKMIHNLTPTRQTHDKATYTRKISKSDGYISFSYLIAALNGSKHQENIPLIIEDYYQVNKIATAQETIPARIIENMYRALAPWPGIWTRVLINGIEKRLKLTALHREGDSLCIDKLQLEGKAETNFDIFNRAYKVF